MPMVFWLAPLAGFAAFALNEVVNPYFAFLGKVHSRGNPRGVALTFDDGPHPLYTPKVLELLQEFRARATFFVVGRYLGRHGEVAAAASRAGHLIANHSFHHYRTMSFLSSGQIRKEILKCQDAVEKWVGYRPRFYRQPAWFRNPLVFGILRDMGMSLVGCQSWAFDSQEKDPRKIARRILAKVRPGGIILLHDGSDSEERQDRTATLEALPLILQGLRDRGMEFLRLDELLRMEKEAQGKRHTA